MARPMLASVRLTPAETAALLEQHPTLVTTPPEGERAALVIVGAAHLVAPVEAAIRHLAIEEARGAPIVEASAPDVRGAVERDARLAQRELQAAARAGFRAAVECLTTAMVGRRAGAPARRAAALVRLWESEGRIFAVPSRRPARYPAFQFDPVTGQPRPVIGAVLAHLQHETPWGRALWWTAPSGWLGGRRPLDVLADDEAAVVRAAAQDARPPEC